MDYPKTSLFLCATGLIISALGLFILGNFVVFIGGLMPTIILIVDNEVTK